nr:MAG TPA: hypothetical protein [Caudoviricetes sp.]
MRFFSALLFFDIEVVALQQMRNLTVHARREITILQNL